MNSFQCSNKMGFIALGEDHNRSFLSVSCFRNVALERAPMLVSLNTAGSRPSRVGRRPLLFSPCVLSFRLSVMSCSDPFSFRKFLKSLSTLALPDCGPVVVSAVLASLFERLFPLTDVTNAVDPVDFAACGRA